MGDGEHCIDCVLYLQADNLPLSQSKFKGTEPLFSPAWNYIYVHRILNIYPLFNVLYWQAGISCMFWYINEIVWVCMSAFVFV